MCNCGRVDALLDGLPGLAAGPEDRRIHYRRRGLLEESLSVEGQGVILLRLAIAQGKGGRKLGGLLFHDAGVGGGA